MLFYFYFFPLILIAWFLVFPTQAALMIENLKQRFDQFLIQRLAQKKMDLLRERFRTWGKLNGCDQRSIDKMFDKHASEILQRIKRKYSGVTIDELV